MIRLNVVYLGFTVTDVRTGRDLFVASGSYDVAGVASTYGWTPCAECDATDGTIDCQHHSAGVLIGAADQWLRDHDGADVDDPGYFDDDLETPEGGL